MHIQFNHHRCNNNSDLSFDCFVAVFSLYVCVVETSSNQESISSINILENQSNEEIENDIYYHRELLINSIESRRIDLLTISSFHNIQKEQEYRFPELFPDPHSKRCKTFKNKKVHWHLINHIMITQISNECFISMF